MAMTTKMSRTLITLTPTEMRWLKRVSLRKNVSMASIVREALLEYRLHLEATGTEGAVTRSAGIWRGKDRDGASYVESLRSEWER